MYKLTYKLSQQTVLIHFQPEQEGATLRASELKPKLDKFLIKELDLTTKQGDKTLVKPTYENWFLDKGKNNLALDYKVKVRAEEKLNSLDDLMYSKHEPHREKDKDLQGFFGNMMQEGEYDSGEKTPKKAVFHLKVKIDFIIGDSLLRTKLKELFPKFLALTNFGTRQSKGFGSFYIANECSNYKQVEQNWFDYKFSIPVTSNNRDWKMQILEKQEQLFNGMNVFYKCLRSGYNQKNRNNETELYLKPWIFRYMKSKDIQWEKKTIKEEFFNHALPHDRWKDLPTQKGEHPESDALHFSSPQKFLTKTVFGLSSTESWRYYKNATINKAQIQVDTESKPLKDRNGNVMLIDKKLASIERFNSPITLVPIYDFESSCYIVYIKVNAYKAILGQWFGIQNGDKIFPLQVLPNFNFYDFFEFVLFNKENLETSISLNHRAGNRNQSLKRDIMNIYNSLVKI